MCSHFCNVAENLKQSFSAEIQAVIAGAISELIAEITELLQVCFDSLGLLIFC
jgi:hypothetical protein